MVTFRKKSKTGPVGDFIGGLIFLAAGLAVIYFMGSDTTLTCNRDQNQCVLQEENLFKETEIITTLNLSDIQRAEMQESRNSKGQSSYRVMLVTPDLRVPLSEVASGGYSSNNKIANKINAYLQSNDKDLSATLSGTLPTVIGLLFAAAGAFLALRTLWKLVRLVLGLVLVAAK